MTGPTADRVRHPLATTALIASTVVLGACGGGPDEGAAAAADATDEGAAPATDEADEGAAPATDVPEDETSSAADGGDADGGEQNATLTLGNGDTLQFSAMCALEPQEVAGSTIEFTAVSYDDPSLDVTQFGDEGTVRGTAVITVTEGEAPYETLWDAGTMYEVFGGTIELALDGTTITGSGSFYPGGDTAVEPVEGELVVSC